MKGTRKGCGSSWDRVMGWGGGGVIEMKGTDQGWWFFLGCGNRDEGLQQRMGFLWRWGNRVWHVRLHYVYIRGVTIYQGCNSWGWGNRSDVKVISRSNTRNCS